MFREINTCIRCGKNLHDCDDDLSPVIFSKGNELCAQCYGELSPEEIQNYFH